MPEYDSPWEEESPDNPWEDDEPTDEDLEEIEREDDEFGEDMQEMMAAFEADPQAKTEAEEAFTERYGFVHNCRCAEDWEEGNLGVVSVCYLGMVTDAMECLANTREELKDANRTIAKLRIENA